MLRDVDGAPTMRARSSAHLTKTVTMVRSTATVMRVEMAVMQILDRGYSSRRLASQNPHEGRLTTKRLATTHKRMCRCR